MPSGNLGVRLYGYTQEEIDTIIIRWYAAGTNFQNQTDSEFIDSATAMHYYTGNDSTHNPFYPAVDNSGEKYFSPQMDLVHGEGRDVELILPGANKVHRVTEMKFEGEVSHEFEYSCSDEVPKCYRKLVSYKVDGWLGNQVYGCELRK